MAREKILEQENVRLANVLRRQKRRIEELEYLVRLSRLQRDQAYASSNQFGKLETPVAILDTQIGE